MPLVGDQRPRVCSLPPGGVSQAAGQECVELSASNGLVLDDWQAWTLRNAMAETDAGAWAAFEVGIVLSRQNGKNGIVEAREIGGLFLLDESLIIHTAHEFKAAEEHFRRVRDTVESNDWLRRRVKRITSSHGEEGIELLATPTLIMGSMGKMVRKSVKPRLRFLARSRGAGRSFSAKLLVWDEAMILTDDQVGAAMPTLSAVPNPQLWYTGSAGDLLSVQLGRIRRRGLTGGDPSLAYFEWSIDPHTEFCNLDPRKGRVCTEHDDPEAPESWARANPGLGIRISPDYVRKEMASLAPAGVRVSPPDVFARERLGVGNWPVDGEGWNVITEDAWMACEDENSPKPERPVAIAVDATPDQSSGSIAIAGKRADGKTVVMIPDGDHRGGVSWIVPRLLELKRAHRPCAIVIDTRGPAGGLVDEAEKAGLEITAVSTSESAQAFAQFYVAVTDAGNRQIVHLGQPELRHALAGAVVRDVGDGAKLWARRSTATDISPLVAVTLAAWAHGKYSRGSYDLLRSVASPS